MGFLGAVLGFITDILDWFRGSKDRQIGREEQQNADLQETVRKLEAEKDSLAAPADAADDLRKGSF